jgi:SAM-dependent methyltransferase
VKEKGSVVALDFSWNMIFKAKKKLHAHQEKPNLHFVNASVEALPLKEKTVDYVTCLDTFAHVTEKQKALSEMERALKRGGKLFIVHTLGKKELAEYHRLEGGEVEHDTLPEDDDMKKMMEKAGFKDMKIIDHPNLYLASAKKSGLKM